MLCLLMRGEGLPKPSGAEKFGSNHRERSKPLGHSRKPEHYRRMIESMTGGLPVLELFARRCRTSLARGLGSLGQSKLGPDQDHG